MSAVDRYGSPVKQQRTGNDWIYGPGTDGDGVIASSTYMQRDMYYNNLTINSGAHLNTNGFRLFVKGTLTINGSVGIASTTTNNDDSSTPVSTKTVSGLTTTSTSVTNSIGGSAAGITYTASSMPTSVMNYIVDAMRGSTIDVASSLFNAVTGGAGGGTGATGTLIPVVPAGAGGVGALDRNALAPGGPGSAGTLGPNAPLAVGGAGGRGGPVVAISAKIVVGTGSIVSVGRNGSTGGPAVNPGPLGLSGTAAPNQALAHHVDGVAPYRTGDGTHGPHANYPTPNLPHGSHVPATSQVLHADRFVRFHVFHNDFCPNAAHGGYGHYHGFAGVIHDNVRGYHGHSPVSPAEHTPDFHTINGIPHNHGHRNHGGIAFSGYGHAQHVDTPSAEHVNHHGAGGLHCSNTKGHFTVPLVQHTRVGYAHYHVSRNAGTVSHVGHVTAPGGSAGAAGRGSGTTAGGNGESGGGGGIIIVTDSTPAAGITTNVAGGSIGGVSGSSGNVIVVINA